MESELLDLEGELDIGDYLITKTFFYPTVVRRIVDCFTIGEEVNLPLGPVNVQLGAREGLLVGTVRNIVTILVIDVMISVSGIWMVAVAKLKSLLNGIN